MEVAKVFVVVDWRRRVFAADLFGKGWGYRGEGRDGFVDLEKGCLEVEEATTWVCVRVGLVGPRLGNGFGGGGGGGGVGAELTMGKGQFLPMKLSLSLCGFHP